jgi:hypothetical protein
LVERLEGGTCYVNLLAPMDLLGRVGDRDVVVYRGPSRWWLSSWCRHGVLLYVSAAQRQQAQELEALRAKAKRLKE